MPTVTLLIHGWSDCSESFEGIKNFLIKKDIGKVETIFFADYESREDNITYNDIIDGLNDELIKKKFIDENGEKLCDLNVVVHSTGGLVIRHWIWRYYNNRIAACPVKRLIMLAPANFGSPLAHRGKSFIGSLAKGRWKLGDLLETGRQILEGLELGSPYQWALAHKDLFVENPYYTADKIQTTILVGVEDYEGIRSWVNKPGTDGTVVIAGTSLDTVKFTLDFTQTSNGTPYQWNGINPPDEFGFGVLEELNHGSIVENIGRDDGGNAKSIDYLLVEALNIQSPDNFREFITKLENITESTYNHSTDKNKYQQFILHAIDDQGVSIRDYTVEFFVFKADARVSNSVVAREDLSDDEQELSSEAHKIITCEFHTHSVDSSYRRLLVNKNEIETFLRQVAQKLGPQFVLSMRMYVPSVDKGIKYKIESLQNIVIYDSRQTKSNVPQFFYENTTTLVELKVDRFNEYVTINQEPSRH